MCVRQISVFLMPAIDCTARGTTMPQDRLRHPETARDRERPRETLETAGDRSRPLETARDTPPPPGDTPRPPRDRSRPLETGRDRETARDRSRSLDEISGRDLWTRSLGEISGRDLWTRSLDEITGRDLWGFAIFGALVSGMLPCCLF